MYVFHFNGRLILQKYFFSGTKKESISSPAACLEHRGACFISETKWLITENDKNSAERE